MEAAVGPLAPIEQLDAAIDAAIRLDPDGVDDSDLHRAVVAVQQATSRLEAASARLVSAWDARTVWAGDGSKSPIARLARDAQCSRRTAAATVHRARRLRIMPLTNEAFQRGDLSVDHVACLTRANVPHRQAFFARDESSLVSDGKRLEVDDFTHVVR